ncbi:MAG: hypothetical protein CMK54_05035 [Proteobacteria bacterium]|nr:hypothetical protein [Pseudomonadota bacterium]
MITGKNLIQMSGGNPCLATVLSGTVLLNVNKEFENDTIPVYESTQAAKLKFFLGLKNTVFALSIENKFTILCTES